MNKTLIRVPLAALTLALAAAGLAYAAEPLQPYPVKGQVVQRLNAFDNPEGSIFSADGKFVFVSNSAELGMPDKGFHWTHKGGYISKLAVQPDGTLKMVNEKLITGLTGPLGMAVSPVATKKFPKGTIFLIEAWAPSGRGRRDRGQRSQRARSQDHCVQYGWQGARGHQDGGRLGGGGRSWRESRRWVTPCRSTRRAICTRSTPASQAVPSTRRSPTKGGGAYMFPVSSLDALAERPIGARVLHSGARGRA